MIRLFWLCDDEIVHEALTFCKRETERSLPFDACGNPFAGIDESELKKIAAEYLSARLGSPAPMKPAVEFERRFLSHPERKPMGIVYDALRLSILFLSRTGEDSTVVLKDLIVSRDSGGDYHLRTAFFAPVVLISLPGFVEAPARKKGYYLARRLGLFIDDSNALKHNDVRIPKVLSGYLLQAFFYLRTGEPFCEKKRCRLYNAHWQDELIEAQIHGSLCERHRLMLEELLNEQT